jgi:hypothetical protein
MRILLLISLLFLSCTSSSEIEDVKGSSCGEQLPEGDPVYCKWDYMGACCVWETESFHTVYCYEGLKNCENYCLESPKTCWYNDKFSPLLRDSYKGE